MAQLHVIGLNLTTGKLENLGGSNDSGGLITQPSGSADHALEIVQHGIGDGLKITHDGGSGYALELGNASGTKLQVTSTGNISLNSSADIYMYMGSSYRSTTVVVGPSSMLSSWTASTGFQWEDANCSSVLAPSQQYRLGDSKDARTIPAVLWIPVEVPDQSVLTSVQLVAQANTNTTCGFALMRSDHSVTGPGKTLYKDENPGSWVTDGTHTVVGIPTGTAQRITRNFSYPPTLDRTGYDYWIVVYLTAGTSSPYAKIYSCRYTFRWMVVRPR